MTPKRTTLEKIAPSIEEAVQDGLAELGLPKEAVEITVLDEGTKGLFGLGSRQARVRISVKAEEERPALQEDSPPEDVPQPREKTTGEDDYLLKLGRETVEELLEKMRVKAVVTAYYGESDDPNRHPPVHVDITGDDLSILIGRKAETLNALQYITKLILGKELERSVPLIVDVEGFRGRRERQIRQLSRTVANQVSKTGRSQALEPMPPNERRFAHIELRDDKDVYTESTGEGPRRKVVIYPRE